jgi:hypothetical protein
MGGTREDQESRRGDLKASDPLLQGFTESD